MTALNPLLAKVFRGVLDLNGPVLGRIFYLFEYARSYIEERSEDKPSSQRCTAFDLKCRDALPTRMSH